MTDKELKQLSRKKLLELLIERESENEQLKLQLEQSKNNITFESVMLDKSKPFSAVSVKLSAVFKAADEAAKQYLDNLARASAQQQQAYDSIVAAAERRAAEIIAEANAKAGIISSGVSGVSGVSGISGIAGSFGVPAFSADLPSVNTPDEAGISDFGAFDAAATPDAAPVSEPLQSPELVSSEEVENLEIAEDSEVR